MKLEDPSHYNPKGYKPLELEYRDNCLWMPDGTLFIPDFEVGQERHQIDLFIEYERTFGRGRAFEATHTPLRPNVDPRVKAKIYGAADPFSIQFDWQKISKLIKEPVKSGTPAQARELIQRIRDFRKKYPNLYDDANDHPTPGHA
jgi:hypothetical protein